MKKYELVLTDSKVVYGITLYRIKALVSISRYGINVCDLGGYIEGEKNLSQDSDAWVSGDAQVSGNARVYGNAWVFGNALVSGDVHVFGNAQVYG